jgi:hypothetical protein
LRASNTWRTETIPKVSDVLVETKDADKLLLLARKMNDTAMYRYNLSSTDKVSQMALYNCTTTELPDGDAAKLWKNMFKIFHAKNINKMNELKSEFVKSTLNSEKDEWFADL